MLDLGFVLVLTLVAAGLGLCVVDRLLAGLSRVEAFTLAIPLGFGLISLATLGLAEAGFLTRSAIVTLLVSALAIAIGTLLFRKPMALPVFLSGHYGQGRWNPEEKAIQTASLAVLPSAPQHFESPSIGIAQNRRQSAERFLNRVFDLLLAVTVLGSLLTAMAPVTDGDALCYHLQVPKVFLDAGRATFEPDLHETIYPLSTEMLYAIALSLRGPVACRLIQWVLGLSFAASVAALARPILGDRSRWAAAIALGVPAISNGMGAPLNDVALAAFGNAALVAWLRWRQDRSAASAILAGILAGMAIGVKYPALVWAGVLAGAMLAVGVRQRWRSTLVHITLFGGFATLLGGAWYLRAFLATGNPVFPFFRGLFGSGIDDVLDPIKRPMSVTPWSLLTSLGPMTLDPDRFDSVSHQLGPAFLLFLPGFLLFRPPRRVVAIAALGWVFLTLCLTQRQSMRFILIAVGPLSVAVAWVALACWERRTVPARALLGIMLAILAAESCLAIARSRHGWPVLLGRETASAYLDRREPTHLVGRWMAASLPPSARVIGQDHRGFYLPRPYTMELAHRRRTGLGRRGESTREVLEHLRRNAFTHVLLCPPIPESSVEFDPTLGRLLAPWIERRTPLFSQKIADADGVVRLYSIHAIDDEPPRLARTEEARR